MPVKPSVIGAVLLTAGSVAPAESCYAQEIGLLPGLRWEMSQKDIEQAYPAAVLAVRDKVSGKAPEVSLSVADARIAECGVSLRFHLRDNRLSEVDILRLEAMPDNCRTSLVDFTTATLGEPASSVVVGQALREMLNVPGNFNASDGALSSNATVTKWKKPGMQVEAMNYPSALIISLYGPTSSTPEQMILDLLNKK